VVPLPRIFGVEQMLLGMDNPGLHNSGTFGL
jgi:hypothetical protein